MKVWLLLWSGEIELVMDTIEIVRDAVQVNGDVGPAKIAIHGAFDNVPHLG